MLNPPPLRPADVALVPIPSSNKSPSRSPLRRPPNRPDPTLQLRRDALHPPPLHPQHPRLLLRRRRRRPKPRRLRLFLLLHHHPRRRRPPKPRYVVSATGQAANPADIIASCREMQSHLDKMRSDAERDLAQLKDSIRQRELAEKRRIAPGWLDSDVRVLEPERKHADATPDSGAGAALPEGVSEMATDTDEGAELDRAFGTLKV
ncbi:unnamed protein product [Parascedosporium putredinis]|uniref:Uncharacterized protein n=1 Tax=Parascedosporium putredinis TaxID=1442378 RepID=A0A9P1GV01_9PEZI|nr:unnamed protein product [Parascedosporium putredinis]CAI7987575.1 unnamed protein product [Parascedosporium putredinis]